MKVLLAPFALALLSVVCCGQVTTKATAKMKFEPFIFERLRNYFETNEERPSHIVNNTYDLKLRESRTQKITIGDHIVEWIDEVLKTALVRV